jgi:hypothetical protein
VLDALLAAVGVDAKGFIERLLSLDEKISIRKEIRKPPVFWAG